MLKISSKIENYLSDKNMIENFYSIDHGKYTAHFGFIGDDSYINILNYDGDGYLISEKKYLIPNRGCLNYIGFSAMLLLKALKNERYKTIKETLYIYDIDEDNFNKVNIVKKIEKTTDSKGTEVTLNREYKYRNGYLHEMREIYINGGYDQYDKIYEYDYIKGETILTISSLFEDKIEDLVVESHKVLNCRRHMYIIKTKDGTVSSVRETIPSTPITRRSYMSFNISVQSEDEKNIYIIDSENETIERERFESIGILGRPRHVKAHRIYRLSRELIEKMMKEE